MGQTLYDYFQCELHGLQEAMFQFAKDYPAAASRLKMNTADSDPTVARLLEGCAYLQARTKQQIDLGMHQLSASLLREIAPQHVMPKPSKTIVEFKSRQHRLTSPTMIPSGTALSSLPVGEEQSVSEFMTLQNLTLWPMCIKEVSYGTELSETYRLSLSFELYDGVKHDALKLGALPLFIHASRRVALQWHYYLTCCVTGVFIQQDGCDMEAIGGQGHIKPLYLKPFKSLISSEVQYPGAFESFGDYARFPERFYFIQCDLKTVHLQKRRFDLIIECSKGSSELQASSRLFKLHCIPAVNAIVRDTEPVLYRRPRADYPLIISHEQPQSQRLLAIKQVMGMEKGAFYEQPLLEFRHSVFGNDRQGYYRLSQTHEKKGLVRNQLSFSGRLPETLYIRCEALAFNGHYPREYIQANALFLKSQTLSGSVEATNLTRPSSHDEPVFDRAYAEVALSLVNARIECFKDLDFLKRLLRLQDTSGQVSLLIKGIRNIQMKAFNRMAQGMIMRGILFEYTFSEETQSIEEWHLVAMMLHHGICSVAPLNTLIETRFYDAGGHLHFIWCT